MKPNFMPLDFRQADIDGLRKDKRTINKAIKDLERKRRMIDIKIKNKLKELGR